MIATKVSTLQGRVLLLPLPGTQARHLASCDDPLRARSMSSDVSKRNEPEGESAVERETQLTGESTDAETGILWSEFLKSLTGEYLTAGGEESKSAAEPSRLERGGTRTRGCDHSGNRLLTPERCWRMTASTRNNSKI